MPVAVAPRVPPSGLTAVWVGPNSTPRVNLAWVDNSVSETNWTVQRGPAPTGPWTDIAVPASTTGPQTGGAARYTDMTVSSGTTYYYRVLATNVVGDTTQYSLTSGSGTVLNSTYPYVIVSSAPSSVVPPVFVSSAGDKTGVYPAWCRVLSQDGQWLHLEPGYRCFPALG